MYEHLLYKFWCHNHYWTVSTFSDTGKPKAFSLFYYIKLGDIVSGCKLIKKLSHMPIVQKPAQHVHEAAILFWEGIILREQRRMENVSGEKTL